jgi:hypothetical protein
VQHALLPLYSPLEITPHKAGIIRDGLMTALGALIDVASQRRRATAGDGPQYTQLLEVQPRALIHETVALLVE